MQPGQTDQPAARLEGLPFRWFAFVAWLLCVSAVAWHHEPWGDEARAWLLARDSSLAELFITYLRYEGAPPLWHLLLMPFAKLGAPYWTMTALSVASAACGVWLLLFKTRLPLALVMILPFTYWFFYQYAVVARNYCLVLPTALLVALAYPKRYIRPWLWFGALALFASVSFHTLLIACGVIVAETLGALAPSSKRDRSKIQTSLQVVAAWTLLILALAWILWPAADCTQLNFTSFRPKGALYDIAGGFAWDNDWTLRARLSLLGLLLSFAFLAAMVRQAALRGILWLSLISSGPLVCFYSLRAPLPYHGGIFACWVLALVVLSTSTEPINVKHRANPILILLVGVIIAYQLWWALWSSAYDLGHPYWPAAAIAPFIEQRIAEGRSMEAVDWSTTSVLPYLSKNPFRTLRDNSKHGFWEWRIHTPYTELTLEKAAALHPDSILCPAFSWDCLPTLSGYTPTVASFSSSPNKTNISRRITFILYDRTKL